MSSSPPVGPHLGCGHCLVRNHVNMPARSATCQIGNGPRRGTERRAKETALADARERFGSTSLLDRWLARDDARLAGELDDVQAGIGAVGDVDVAAVIDLGVVALDHRIAAALLAADHAAARLSGLRDRRDEVADLLGIVRVAD